MRPDGTAELGSRLFNAFEQLHLQPGPADPERLLAFLRLIERWNRVYNLTALKTSEEMFTHHLLDCLAIVPSLDRWFASTTGRAWDGTAPDGDVSPTADSGPAWRVVMGTRPRLLDVGSGAGLPGVILAILRPDWRVTCIDTVAKKAAFLRQVGGELGLANLSAVHGRVETPDPWLTAPFDLVISRAFAALSDFVKLTRASLAPQGVWAAMKAQLPEAEIDSIPAEAEMFHVEQIQVPELDVQRCLAWLRPRPVISHSAAEHRQSPA